MLYMSLSFSALREFCWGCLEDSQLQVDCISTTARGISVLDSGRKAKPVVMTINQHQVEQSTRERGKDVWGSSTVMRNTSLMVLRSSLCNTATLPSPSKGNALRTLQKPWRFNIYVKPYLFYHHSLLQSLIKDSERATFAVGPSLQWQSEEVRNLSSIPATDFDPSGLCSHQREPPAPVRWVRGTSTFGDGRWLTSFWKRSPTRCWWLHCCTRGKSPS